MCWGAGGWGGTRSPTRGRCDPVMFLCKYLSKPHQLRGKQLLSPQRTVPAFSSENVYCDGQSSPREAQCGWGAGLFRETPGLGPKLPLRPGSGCRRGSLADTRSREEEDAETPWGCFCLKRITFKILCFIHETHAPRPHQPPLHPVGVAGLPGRTATASRWCWHSRCFSSDLTRRRQDLFT